MSYDTFLAQFVQAVQDLGGQQAEYALEKIVTYDQFGNFIRSGDSLELIRPDHFKVNSLDGLLDYWSYLKLEENALFSVSQKIVNLEVSKATASKFGEIITYASAVPISADLTFLGNNMTQETAIIKIRTSFTYDDEAQKLLSSLGSLVLDGSITTDDDGVSQNVTARSGIDLSEKTKLGAVTLKPYETFAEVLGDIPGRLYNVRVKKEGGTAVITLHTNKDPSVDMAIFKAIKKYLVARLTDRGVSGEVAERMVSI